MIAMGIEHGNIALRGHLDDGEWKDTKTQELITMYPPAVYEGTWGQGLLALDNMEMLIDFYGITWRYTGRQTLSVKNLVL